MDLPFNPAVLFLGICPKEPKRVIRKKHKHPCVHCNVMYNHQDMEAAQVSISRLVGKTTMRHLHHGILFGCFKKKKKKENTML